MKKIGSKIWEKTVYKKKWVNFFLSCSAGDVALTLSETFKGVCTSTVQIATIVEITTC